jgi:hypothetical protein
MVKRMTVAAKLSVLAGVAAALGACTPEIVDTTPIVDRPIVLAAIAAPAEAPPGAPLALSALVVGPDGPAARPIDWALCTIRPPLTSPGALAPDCFGADGPALVPIGTGDAASTAMPADVCQTFGPDQPAPKPGQPAGRPADPDPTGGYYQPIRIFDPDAGDRRATLSFEARALCHVATATPAQQAEFDRRYRLNENPIIAGLAPADGTPLPSVEGDPAAVTSIPAGTPLDLRVTWPACPNAGEDACGDGVCGIDETADACPDDCTMPKGCGGAETYLWFDPVARAFAPRRESIVVSWFATAGVFATARTGHDEAEAAVATDSANVWTAPAGPADVWLWVVLRDARGGVAWSTYKLRVE